MGRMAQPSWRVFPANSLPLLLLRLSFLLLAAHPAKAGYIVTVPAKDEACFQINSHLTNGGTLYGNYEILTEDRSSDVVSVILMDAKNQRTLYRSRKRSTDGTFRVNLQANQKVELCLQNGIFTAGKRKTPTNRAHDGLDRTIGVTYDFEETNLAKELENTNQKLLTSTKTLHREIGRLQDHYTYSRAREATHRETIETTFSRLMSWVLLQGFTVICVAAAQIMYFRRFLEQRRYI